MIYIFVFSILVLFIASFIINKKEIIAPAVIFSFGFLFQSIWALLYSNKWELSLHINTYCVIVGGILIFIIISKIVSLLYRKIKHSKVAGIDYIDIKNWKKICFLIFCIISTLYYLYFVVNSVGGDIFNIKSIMHSISEFDKITKFSNEFIKIPFLVGNLRTIVMASGFWFLYVIINNYISTKKIDFLSITIVLVSMIISVLNGSRGGFFFMIVAGIEYLFMIKNQKNDQKNKSKIIIKIGLIAIVFLLLFSSFAKLLGRNINMNTADYLSIYCGAEVKNLDLFLQESHKKNVEYFGAQTFQPIVTSIGRKIGFYGYKDYKLDLPFRKVGEYSLGNVYTTFYPYIYDFGYIGLIVLVALMAVISQIVYENAKNKNNKNSPSIYSVAYGVIFTCLMLSFFSNKFYENVFSTEFIKRIILWIIFNYFFCKFSAANFKKSLSKIFKTKQGNERK